MVLDLHQSGPSELLLDFGLWQGFLFFLMFEYLLQVMLDLIDHVCMRSEFVLLPLHLTHLQLGIDCFGRLEEGG